MADFVVVVVEVIGIFKMSQNAMGAEQSFLQDKVVMESATSNL